MIKHFVQQGKVFTLSVGMCVMGGPCVDIGQPLQEACLTRVKGSNHLVLVTPNQLEPGFEFDYQTARYTGVVRNGRLVFLSTVDPAFRTPEGVSTRTTLGQLHLTPTQGRLIPGWARVYRLPSGWCCAFASDAPLGEDAKMQFLYKQAEAKASH